MGDAYLLAMFYSKTRLAATVIIVACIFIRDNHVTAQCVSGGYANNVYTCTSQTPPLIVVPETSFNAATTEMYVIFNPENYFLWLSDYF